MTSKSLYVIALLVGALGVQSLSMYLLPLTRGAAPTMPTLGVVACFLVYAVLLGRLMSAGMNLSVLVPLMAAAGPLGGIAIGTLVYGEAVSALRLAALFSACALVVISNFL